MVYEIVWSREAASRFDQILTYLKMEWSRKEVKEFADAVNKTLETIANYPFLFRISESNINREALITRHNLLIYKVENEKIVLLTLWDNRMNPKKRKL